LITKHDNQVNALLRKISYFVVLRSDLETVMIFMDFCSPYLSNQTGINDGQLIELVLSL
jgi:hypothetical protein